MIKLRYMFICFLCAIVFSACTDATYIDELSKVEEGFDAHIKICLKSSSIDRFTRATSSEADEGEIYNLCLLIFNENGSLASRSFFAYSSLKNKELQIKTISGTNKTIYGVANFGLGMMSVDSIQLSQITRRSDLENIKASLLQSTLSRGSSFMMTGFLSDKNASEPKRVSISPGDQTAQSLGTIYLSRVDAKVKFELSTKEGVTFDAKEWRVVNASDVISLYPKIVPVIFSEKDDYFTSDWFNMEGNDLMAGKEFSFYVLENRNVCKKEIPKDNNTPEWMEYLWREKQVKKDIQSSVIPGQIVENGDFEYAPQFGTYIQVKGRIDYIDSKGVLISGDVIYNIHLGYVKLLGKNPSKANDYEVNRNSNYTYKVRIESVNNIIIEVETDDKDTEPHPGAEGDIVYNGIVMQFDSHFETALIEFRQDVKELKWTASTPFSSFSEAEKAVDYKWIYFKLNPLDGENRSKVFTRYPGTNEIFPEGVTIDEILIKPEEKLLNIKQLISLLNKKDSRLYGKDNIVRFTAFIHENYYEKRPGDPEGNTDLFLWKQFVNTPDRVLNIISTIKYSPDGQSSLSESLVSFRQASIQTMYNVNLNNDILKTAWGTEMIQDKNRYSVDKSNEITGITTSGHDGRTNTINLWNIASNPEWSRYVDPSFNSMTKEYKYARYACMQRNRDLDGDGKIAKSEVRWYLASIDQLTDLWLGERSFDKGAALFKMEDAINYLDGNKTMWKESWFVSSSLSGNNPLVLWSATGSSVGPLNSTGQHQHWGVPVLPDANKNQLYYRCVRNLGIPESSDEVPEDFVKKESLTENGKVFKRLRFEKLNYKSVRAYSQLSELINHNERSAENLPYKVLDVYFGTHGSGLFWKEVKDRADNGNSVCPEGWRIPNQRELSYMLSRLRDDGGWTYEAQGNKFYNHMSRTAFSQSAPDSDYPGFSVKISDSYKYIVLIKKHNDPGGVRCVRDGVQQ